MQELESRNSQIGGASRARVIPGRYRDYSGVLLAGNRRINTL